MAAASTSAAPAVGDEGSASRPTLVLDMDERRALESALSQNRSDGPCLPSDLLQELRLQREALGRLEIAQHLLSDAILQALGKQEPEDADIDTDLDYIDSWPRVEVTVIMNELARFDFMEMTFDVDCTIYFDWKDSQMKKNVHYSYNPERANFELTSALRGCKNDRQFFNPTLHIVNGINLEVSHEDPLPSIHTEIDHDGVDVPWLTKKFHVVGQIECRQASAVMFPFDVQGLKIRIAVPDMTGITSLGQARKVALVEPDLRKQLIQKEILRAIEKEESCPYVPVEENIPMSHRWKVGDDGTSTLDVGEMQTLAYGGVSQPHTNQYCLYILLRRRWYPRYVFDILIMNLEVLIAGMSVYVPFNPDMLANRLGISLAILLTLVAGLASRPAAIERVSYSSAFDIYGQVMLMFVIIIALGNLAVFMNCWGSFRTAGVDDVYDQEMRMVINNVASRIDSEFWCAPGEYWSFGASKMDGVILWLSYFGQFSALVGTLVRAQMVRYSAVLSVKHELDSGDADSNQYSRLVFCTDKFSFMSRNDLAGCASKARLLPFPACFWKMWGCCRRCRKRYCCLIDKFPIEFHAMEAEDLLKEADKKKSRESDLPSISTFRVKLSKLDIFRMMDVGSGELGFYSYSWDEHLDCVKVAGTDGKLKYQKGNTFVDEFVTNNDGAEVFAEELRARFNLVNLELNRELSRAVSGHTAQLRATAQPNDIAAFGQSIVGAALPGLISGEETQSPPVTLNSSISPGRPQTRETKKKKLMMCLTGANRQLLRDDGPGRKQLEDFVYKVNQLIGECYAECILFSPDDTDEAMYELKATDFVVQHGDLDVSTMRLEKTHKTLQGRGPDAMATWDEVRRAFSDLKAETALKGAYRQAAGSGSTSNDSIPEAVSTAQFYEAFNDCHELMRALVRSRSFSGTLSAGSGSCQVTFRNSGSSSQVYSLPVGNRTPMTSMKITPGHEETLFNKKLKNTNEAAQKLLLRGGNSTETKPAWSDDGPVETAMLETWQKLVTSMADEKGLPTNRNGLFVGISAVFYAAKLAGCDKKVLHRDEFLKHLRTKKEELIADGAKDGRGLANLTLVMGLVEAVLHPSAQIVCKRDWKVGGSAVVATWSLGMYLKTLE